MKKQYILAVLLLLGVGIVTTLAFDLDADLTVGSSVYDVQSTYSTGDITKVTIKPWKDLDNMRIVLTIDGPTSGNFNITMITNVDLSGCTISDSETSYLAADSDLSGGYLVFNDIGNAVTKLTIKIESYTPVSTSLWQEMNSVVFTMTDLV